MRRDDRFEDIDRTYSDISWAYVQSIRNPLKREFAKGYRLYLRGESAKPDIPAGLSYMAAQSVWMQLHEYLSPPIYGGEDRSSANPPCPDCEVTHPWRECEEPGGQRHNPRPAGVKA